MRTYAGPLLISLGYILFYYLTIVNVSRVKTRLRREAKERGERFDRYNTPDKRMLAADRVQLNTLEHMPPFLALLWLDATLVNVHHATAAGGVYLASRMLYPFVLGRQIGSDAPRRVMPLTFTGYTVLGFLWVDLLHTYIRWG